MRERPILFSGAMVRAILAGRKTQTRRIVKGVPPWVKTFGQSIFTPRNDLYLEVSGRGTHPEYGPAENFYRFPFGGVGGRLWVRETFAVNDIRYADGRLPPFSLADLPLVYRADGEMGEQFEQPDGHLPWRPSLFMPRWASRISLEIASVRVERVQEISAEDAVAEGIELSRYRCPCEICARTSKFCPGTESGLLLAFRELWDSVNATRETSWDSNPWVWAISFKRVPTIAEAAEPCHRKTEPRGGL